jgi:hypothetical protein
VAGSEKKYLRACRTARSAAEYDTHDARFLLKNCKIAVRGGRMARAWNVKKFATDLHGFTRINNEEIAFCP